MSIQNFPMSRAPWQPLHHCFSQQPRLERTAAVLSHSPDGSAQGSKRLHALPLNNVLLELRDLSSVLSNATVSLSYIISQSS